ncbi:MAG: ankyrin repeat domain-containing protein [Gemmatimonadaceae bacterium]|nr:ankyrin repeat domain-containing protein [Gemmatimonadaceae bacterium]
MPPRSPSSGRKPGARLGAARFLDAARRWDAEVVAEALRAHPELANVTDRSGRTALHLCAAATVGKARRPVAASIRTARALRRAGAALDAVHRIPDQGEPFPATPLWHAIARGKNRTLARYLLREGASPDYCLWAVVWNDDVVMARHLHEHGANLDLIFHDETALLYATRLRRTRMVRWLLRHGANPNIGDAEGRTPLSYAVRRRYPVAEVEELLRHGADITLRARDGSCPQSLAESGRAGPLAQLLRKYAPADASAAQVA